MALFQMTGSISMKIFYCYVNSCPGQKAYIVIFPILHLLLLLEIFIMLYLVYCLSVQGESGITNVKRIDYVNGRTLNLFFDRLPSTNLNPMSFNVMYKLYTLCLFHKYKYSKEFSKIYFKISFLRPNHMYPIRFINDNNYLRGLSR